MKKLIAGAILASSSALSFAYGPAGCGVGSTVVFPDANEWHEHVLAATTNGTSLNTVSMTSNLLDCDDANGPLKLARIFINDNMDQLALDVAKGEGETLAALAEVIGVEAQDSTAFNHALQSNFDSMFSAEATSATAYEAMTDAMASDASLQKYLG